MKNIKDVKCPSCPSFKYCRGKVSKGSSECDNRRGTRSKKKSKRYSYLKGMMAR